MQSLEQIAAEVVLLSPEDTDARLRLEKMLRGVAQNEEFSEPVRDLAWQAIAAVQGLLQARDPDQCLKQLNDLLDKMVLEEVRAPGAASATNADGGTADRPATDVIDERLIREFLEKQQVTLEEFEAHCLAMERGESDRSAHLKRQIHTWKGEAGLIGYTDLAQMMHDIEEALGKTASLPAAAVANGLLVVTDQLRVYFKARLAGECGTLDKLQVLPLLMAPPVAEAAPAPAPAPTPTPAPVQTVAAALTEAAPAANVVIFEMPSEIDQELLTEFCNESDEHFHNAEQALMALETDPSDMESVNVVFRAFHTVKGTSGFVGLSCVTELAHKAETFFDRFRKGTLSMHGLYTDLAFEALDMLKTILHGIHDAQASGSLPLPAKYRNLIYRLEHLETLGTEAAPAEKAAPAAAAPVTEEGAEKAAEAPEARTEDPAVRAKKVQQSGEADGSVKVSTGRLDNLINMVGELVIAQSMVSQDPAIQRGTDQRFIRNVSQLNKITRSLQELALSMRMVSVKATFQKMARLVRDLARKSGKDILFETEGEDTELDRNMVEIIADPLVHMVRNAADHGLEPPDERLQSGKSRQGRILLSAAHEGGSVLITLKDDGRGLNRQRILAKAVERGLVEAGAQLSDADIHKLIFMPGFSTAEKITDVSGRGVGMDVVRANVEALRGSVDITSTAGQGSVFSMRLPLTLAIIDGMVIRSGVERFILPIVAITETFRPRREDLTTVQGQTELVTLRGSLLPICRLGRMFSIETAGEDLTDSILVVVEGKGHRMAVMVDELLGQQQVVIKSLGSTFGRVEGVSGGAILGDGRISLILDVDGLMRLSGGGSLA